MSASLEIREVSIRYGNVLAVENATLDVAAGSFVALVGPSGCGKTSLLRAIAGLEHPTSGSISAGGVVMSANGTFIPPEQRKIGMMFQEGALFPHLTVAANVAFGSDRRRAMEMLQLVGLETLASRYPHELSGGQQQRVALARALAPSPRAVLLDEPFGGLDAALRVRLREEVRDILRETRTTAVLVTHDQEEALSIADQVSVMQGGRILQTGTPREIYERPAEVAVAELVGDGQLIGSTIREGIVATPFGSLHVEAPEGSCAVQIRTEDLYVGKGAGVSAVVMRSRFFGHDVVDEVQLDDGSTFRVRLPQSCGAAGARVEVGLRVPTLRVFPSSGGAVDAAVQPQRDSTAPRTR